MVYFQFMKIIGMMSGTSADGVDAALVEIDEAGRITRGPAVFEAYAPNERALILSDMGARQAKPETLDAIHAAHNRALARLPEADVVGFHGQTLSHAPQERHTFQAGDPSALQTSARVVYDFRSNDVKAGGEGAPLAPIYHYALAQELGFEAPVEFINIGGVANVSYVDPSQPPEAGLIAFDVGVGNAMSDDLMAFFFEENFDANGERALQGTPNPDWLAAALAHPFFDAPAPKSLDRLSLYENFEALKRLAPEDAIATAMAFCVAGIERARDHYPSEPAMRILAGGGRNNQYLKTHLQAQNIDDFGLDGDMIEAEAFAYLAWLHVNARPASFPMTTGVAAPMLAGLV